MAISHNRGDKPLKRSIIVIIPITIFVVASAFGSGPPAHKTDDAMAMDALGEFLRGLNDLAGGKRALPEKDPVLERIRTKYTIPDRIDILSPRGGNEIIAFIFDSEGLPVIEGRWNEISPAEYRYLQSNHNLKRVYCLYEKEPLDLGEVLIAIKAEAHGMRLYFGDKRGSMDSALVRHGNAVALSGSRYIIKPAAVGVAK